jgi:aldose sugar dehydrogenase
MSSMFIFFLLSAFFLHLIVFNFGSVYAIIQTIGEAPIIMDPSLTAQVVVKGLDRPTQMAFLGPNDFLVSEKNNGKVLRVVNGSPIQKPIIDVNVANEMERGLVGLAVSKNPNLDDHQNGELNVTRIFLFYTESNKDGNDYCPLITYCDDGNAAKGNRLYRYDLKENSVVNPKLLLDLPAQPGADHLGGVIKIGPDNNVYLTGGDGDSCANRLLCQAGNLEGSVLRTQSSNIRDGLAASGRGGIIRVTQDGNPVDDGIIGDTNPLNKYYAYGIRNSYGIDFDPITDTLWDTENGPGFGDEINLVAPGFNSGWLKVQGNWPVSINNPLPKYKGYEHTINKDMKDLKFKTSDLVDFDGRGIYSMPEFVWNMTEGVTAIKFLDSDKLGKKYKNDIFVGNIKNGTIYHFELNKERTAFNLRGLLADNVANKTEETKNIIFAKGFGGITDIDVGPDGYLYVLTFNQGTVYRILPTGR